MNLGLNNGDSMCYFLENPNPHNKIDYKAEKTGLKGMGYDGNNDNEYD